VPTPSAENNTVPSVGWPRPCTIFSVAETSEVSGMEPFDDDESITLANCNSTFLSPLVATIMNAVNGPFEHGFDFGSDKEQKQMRNCLQTQLIEHGWLVFVNDHRNAPPAVHSLNFRDRDTIAKCFCHAPLFLMSVQRTSIQIIGRQRMI